jgi:hypothetical protein
MWSRKPKARPDTPVRTPRSYLDLFVELELALHRAEQSLNCFWRQLI